MTNLPSKPDFLLDRKLAQVTTNKLITDAQIDELIVICDPPTDQLRDNIAVEFERAAITLLSGRAVVSSRAKRRAFQGQLYAAQRYARKLTYLISKIDLELKVKLNNKFAVAQHCSDNPVELQDVEGLLDAFVNIPMTYPPGTKSNEVLVWVIDSLIHAIETRLAPAFDSYGTRRSGKWFSNARQAKLIFAFLSFVEPEKSTRYNLDYISDRIKHRHPMKAMPADYSE